MDQTRKLNLSLTIRHLETNISISSPLSDSAQCRRGLNGQYISALEHASFLILSNNYVLLEHKHNLLNKFQYWGHALYISPLKHTRKLDCGMFVPIK